jgi:hypothetical protein
VKLALKAKAADKSQYGKNGEYILLSMEGRVGKFPNPCCDDEDFDFVSYDVVLQRRILFYLLKYLYPSLLINAMGNLFFYMVHTI